MKNLQRPTNVRLVKVRYFYIMENYAAMKNFVVRIFKGMEKCM